MAPNWPPDEEQRTAEGPSATAHGNLGGGPATNDGARGSATLEYHPASTNGVHTGPRLVPPSTQGPSSKVAVWIDRLGLVIRVVFYIELGMLLAVLPWTRLWTENSLLLAYPQLRDFLQMNFVRGAVTGIGLVDIWIGVWEAVQYRDPK